jgi:hypothetical protein
MKLVVEKTVEGQEFGIGLDSIEELNQDTTDLLEEAGPDIYDMASAILDRFPGFNKVIICSNLTQNGQNNNKERNDSQR